MSQYGKPFVTADWLYLALHNYECDPEPLQPLVPGGTELDTWNGRTFVSMVGFSFLNTRVLAWRFRCTRTSRRSIGAYTRAIVK
jgi:uncharacterized protein YqjF (DUF2071 family)